MTEEQGKSAASQLIKEARTQNVSLIKASIQITKNGVEVISNTLETTTFETIEGNVKLEKTEK